ncbi:MAG: hypothetical protein A2521_12725 [Deltaproteobacteria bacterium RIFOXYD12_FULL_57_12]|nr:MAG: hypothetical protein A2521_12725 [Deltaproteobacteria bacterium RIFOXYD12_FULL_57_12]
MNTIKRLHLLIAATIIILTATGCVLKGREFPEYNVTQIEIGRSSRDDIFKLFGSPWRTGWEDGLETWTYGRYGIGVGDSDLVVRYDKNGIVQSYTYSSTASGN